MKKILVIGDGCLDVFQYGKCERLSPEAPVPVFKPLRTTNNGGMAVNVYNNLMALGVEADIHTYSGITKTRYVDEISNQMLLRVDENDQIFVGANIYDRQMAFDYGIYEAIVIVDYNKGFLSEEVIKHIADNHPLVFMDTKKKISGWAKNVKYIKINEKEFNQNQDYLTLKHPNNTIVTLGKRGAMLCHNVDGECKIESFPNTDEHPVRDLTGAGDTFLAGLVAKFIENNDICDAIIFANRCAAWAVTQKGVAVVDRYRIVMIDLISKEEAKELNQKWYFTGEPCGNVCGDARDLLQPLTPVIADIYVRQEGSTPIRASGDVNMKLVPRAPFVHQGHKDSPNLFFFAFLAFDL